MQVDNLVGFIHVGAQFCTRLGLMEVERLRYGWSHALHSLFHLGDEGFLQPLEVWH
jgi:hypothetical protein